MTFLNGVRKHYPMNWFKKKVLSHMDKKRDDRNHLLEVFLDTCKTRPRAVAMSGSSWLTDGPTRRSSAVRLLSSPDSGSPTGIQTVSPAPGGQRCILFRLLAKISCNRNGLWANRGRIMANAEAVSIMLSDTIEKFMTTRRRSAWHHQAVLKIEKGAKCPLYFWSGREDLNLRPPEPHSGALPDCATSRKFAG